jgi:hypothetical protein
MYVNCTAQRWKRKLLVSNKICNSLGGLAHVVVNPCEPFFFILLFPNLTFFASPEKINHEVIRKLLFVSGQKLRRTAQRSNA